MSKIKICHITSVHSTYDVRIFLKECRSLSETGHEVHLVTANQENDIQDNVHIHGVGSPKRTRIKRMMYTVKEVFEYSKNLNADVYHLHDPELLRIALKLQKTGAKVIYDAHEDIAKQVLGKFWIPSLLRKPIAYFIKHYEDRIVSKINGVITATPAINDRFKQINRNAVNINNYPIIEPNSTIKKDVRNEICYVGGITEIRGLKQLIQALEICTKEVKLHLIGSGSESFLNELKGLKGWNKVKYWGQQNREKVKEILSSCKIGVVTFLPLPNHIDAQPNKIFEYMYEKLAIIGSNFPLWKQIIEEKNCGKCVDPLNPLEIAQTIDQLMDNNELTMQMGKNGYEQVFTNFNWDKEKTKLISFYANL